MEVKQKLLNYAKKISIDKIGFASAKPFSDLHDIMVRHRELGYESGFEEKNIKKRVDPSLSLKDAKSIIAVALAYPAKIDNPPKSIKAQFTGIVSRSAWGLDYHLIVEKKLSQLGYYLKELLPWAEYVYMTDTGVLSDHAAAERAGLGWIGKNSLLITPEFGSYVYLGEMITNVEFPEDEPIENQCGECTKCIESCPTNAIIQPGQVNSKNCLSYQTQRKDMLEENWMRKLGNRLYGCDTCQMVCPKNKGVNFTHQEDTKPNPDLVKPLLKPLLNISNEEFKQNWGSTAAAWRGKKPIQRNAIIGLAHFKDKTAIPDLKKLLFNDVRPMIRQTAAWAIGEIGGNDAGNILQVAKLKEKDIKVLQEIRESINKISNQEIQCSPNA